MKPIPLRPTILQRLLALFRLRPRAPRNPVVSNSLEVGRYDPKRGFFNPRQFRSR